MKNGPQHATESTGWLDDLLSPLKTDDPDRINKIAKAAFANVRMRTGSDGWASRMDADVAKETGLRSKEIARRAHSLSLRWADVYLQDIRGSLQSMEADNRYYDELNFRLANQAIDVYSQDEALRIHNNEIAAGWYTVAAEIADLEEKALSIQRDGAHDVRDAYDELFKDPEIAAILKGPCTIGLVTGDGSGDFQLLPVSKRSRSGQNRRISKLE